MKSNQILAIQRMEFTCQLTEYCIPSSFHLSVMIPPPPSYPPPMAPPASLSLLSSPRPLHSLPASLEHLGKWLDPLSSSPPGHRWCCLEG